jgi:hypothetical protein
MSTTSRRSPRRPSSAAPAPGTCRPWWRTPSPPGARTAKIGGGATWAMMNDTTTARGLAATGGIVSSTATGGITLGGGVGYLTRAHGLSCDNQRPHT